MSDEQYFKNEPTDKIWWIDDPETVGEFLFTFDKKQIYNLFTDYPYKLTPQQRQIFDRENPNWKEFFADRG